VLQKRAGSAVPLVVLLAIGDRRAPQMKIVAQRACAGELRI
jgi:hypothetical protein